MTIEKGIHSDNAKLKGTVMCMYNVACTVYSSTTPMIVKEVDWSPLTLLTFSIVIAFGYMENTTN